MGGAKNGLKECLVHNEDVYYGIITHKSRIYEMKNKHYNYTVAYYSKNDKSINPKLMMRFDCHKINEMQCVHLIEKTGSGTDDGGNVGDFKGHSKVPDQSSQLFNEADENQQNSPPGASRTESP